MVVKTELNSFKRSPPHFYSILSRPSGHRRGAPTLSRLRLGWAVFWGMPKSIEETKYKGECND